ncbi:alkane 1-monooxygenase [Nocardia sp. Marseille-Q1738]
MTIFKHTQARDPKRYLWMLGLIAPACALLPSQLVARTGLEVFWWIGPVIVLVLIPLLDVAVGDDGSNPREEDYAALSDDRYYRWCTYLFLPIQFLGLFVAGYLWSGTALSPADKLGLAVTLGFVSGIGINAAHELGHRAEHLERWLAKIALAQSGYGHFFVEHNRGHHVRVATPEDPASARLGESLWLFLPRSMVGGFRSALSLERERLSRKGKRWFSRDNHLLQAWSMTVALFGTMIVVFGPVVIPFLALQALIGAGLLETVNYIEHYGLLRPRRANGHYARCSPRDSWNSDRLVTNLFLFHLQRHSDHHANPGRRYQTLRSSEQAPQLPAGYASMIVLAAIPPLWRAVMDRRVLAHYGGDITLANTKPRPRRHHVLRGCAGLATTDPTPICPGAVASAGPANGHRGDLLTIHRFDRRSGGRWMVRPRKTKSARGRSSAAGTAR